MYICLCNGVTDRTIRESVRSGVSTLQELTAKTGCGSCCGSCLPMAQEIIEREHGRPGQRSLAQDKLAQDKPVQVEHLAFA